MNLNANIEQERSKRLIAMGQMAATLAHEIRNPLGSMELYCSLLKKDLADQHQSLELAEQIHAGIKRLDRIITNCLQFSRDISPRRKVFSDTLLLLRDSLALVQERAKSAGVAIQFTEEGEQPIGVDPYLLQQCFLNLLFNAIESFSSEKRAASDGNMPLVRIISDRTQKRLWQLTVSDNGPGIPLVEQEKVFDPFFTTKQGGTGLGLAIVYSIAQAHHGKVELKSSMESGTTVTLSFPSTVEFSRSNKWDNQGLCQEIVNGAVNE